MIHSKIFFMDKEIIIIKYIEFGLVKIKFVDSDRIFVVDYNALTKEPDKTKTISIGSLKTKDVVRDAIIEYLKNHKIK